MARDLVTRRNVIASCALLTSACGPVGRKPEYWAKTLNGVRYDNDLLKGRVVLMQFWTTWCGYCRSDQPVIDTLAREYGQQGLVILAVNMKEARDRVGNYLRDNPRQCDVVLADDTNLLDVFPVASFPYYVALDRTGTVRGTQRGAGGARALLSLLAKAGLES